MLALWLALAGAAPGALAHGYVKEWTANGVTQKAQKTDLSQTAFRSVSDNTGWVGSKFIESDAITCGASITPRLTVTSPSGKMFADADNSAGKTMDVKAGSSVQVVVSGNPGEGWPHPKGHVQTYLGFCGSGPTACQNFDARKASFFKIQEVKNGIQDKLKPAYDGGVDGNRWDIPIPKSLASGSYIMRFELIAFGQSSAVEGNQDQYYPFCGQINVAGGTASSKSLTKLATVKFPGGYKAGNIDENTVPGPKPLATGSSSDADSPDTSSSSDDDDSDPASASPSSSSSGGSKCSAKRRARRRAKRAAAKAAEQAALYKRQRLAAAARARRAHVVGAKRHDF